LKESDDPRKEFQPVLIILVIGAHQNKQIELYIRFFGDVLAIRLLHHPRQLTFEYSLLLHLDQGDRIQKRRTLITVIVRPGV